MYSMLLNSTFKNWGNHYIQEDIEVELCKGKKDNLLTYSYSRGCGKKLHSWNWEAQSPRWWAGCCSGQYRYPTRPVPSVVAGTSRWNNRSPLRRSATARFPCSPVNMKTLGWESSRNETYSNPSKPLMKNTDFCDMMPQRNVLPYLLGQRVSQRSTKAKQQVEWVTCWFSLLASSVYRLVQ